MKLVLDQAVDLVDASGSYHGVLNLGVKVKSYSINNVNIKLLKLLVINLLLFSGYG